MAAETLGCPLTDLLPDLDRGYCLFVAGVYGQFKAWLHKRRSKT